MATQGFLTQKWLPSQRPDGFPANDDDDDDGDGDGDDDRAARSNKEPQDLQHDGEP